MAFSRTHNRLTATERARLRRTAAELEEHLRVRRSLGFARATARGAAARTRPGPDREPDDAKE